MNWFSEGLQKVDDEPAQPLMNSPRELIVAKSFASCLRLGIADTLQTVRVKPIVGYL